MMPTQNDGRPMPASGIARTAPSVTLPGLLAEIMASGTVMPTANTVPTTISHTVGARLPNTRLETDTPRYW